MADVNANIGVNIDTSAALAQLKALQRQIAQFHTSFAKSSQAAQLAQKGFTANLINSINSIGAFNAELRTIKTTAESFTDSLQKNKFSMREYFRYAGGATKTFGKLFKSEYDTIGKVAEENVKRLQTQYIKLGRDTTGAMKAIAVTPKELDMSKYSTQVQMAAQRQALLNQLLKQGSTNLLNFGKNTQWAGRQLMVGFTLPLAALGTTASRTFFDMETAAIKFRKVYGDLFTPQAEREQALASITELGQAFTKYGIAVSDTVGLAAEAAAAGFKGLDLQRQTQEATRLQVLGQIDAQKALETTISLQNAFQMSSEKLADAINFLNAVENQTVVSLDDITTAIPKVAPVIQQLGGDVKDLAFFLAAMKEGGVNASEGANALKSGLAALINPTNKASAMLQSAGININQIIEANKGNLKATVIAFAQALDTLDPLSRARAIEQLFGKFQFARLSTLFENVTRGGNQASRVLQLTNASASELATTAEQELGITADSAMNKFRKTVENLKLALVPVGQSFIEAITPIVDFIGGILEKFNNLSSGTKRLITLLTVGLGAVGPVLLMTFGLIANGAANLIKLFITLRGGYLRLTGQSNILSEQTQYLTVEQQQAASVAAGLNQSHNTLIQTFNAESTALNQLIGAYQRAVAAQTQFMGANPGMFLPPRGRKLASGIVSVPGPKGAGDVVPAMLSPGEAVIPSDMAKQYAPLIQGMVAGNIPGYQEGRYPSSSKGLVFAHGTPGQAISQDMVNEISKNVSQSMQRYLSQATRVKGFTNFGFVAPENLNKGKMSGTESGQFFQQNAELATSRIYSSIVDLLPSVASNPNVKQDVILFGENIGEQLSLAGSKAVSEPEFYNAVQNALEKTMTQATTQAFKESIPQIQKQITTLATFGGEINRGERGQRTAVSRKAQMEAFGYQQGIVSYKQTTLLSELNKRGYQMGASAIQGVAAGAKAASPSKQAIQIGKDIGAGLDIGMKQSETRVRSSAINLGQTAGGYVQRQSGLLVPGAVGSAPISAVSANIPITAQQLDESFKNVSTRASEFDAKMSSLNNKIMGGSFALMGLTTALSFMDGGVGKFSGTIAKLSGAMFALMTVTQLLTQTKIAQLAADRLAIGKQAAAFATYGAGIGSKSGILGSLARAAIFVTRFIGPVGLVTAGLYGAYKIIQMTNAARERERQAIEGLGKAANLSKDQIKKLGDVYGVTTTQSPLELAKPTVAVQSARRQQIEETKKTFEGDKAFQANIATLKNVTQQQADIIFQSIATKLAGSGFASDAINNILIALQEQAGRTDLKINFKNFDLTTPEGVRSLEQNAALLATKFGTSFEKGFSEQKIFAGGGKGGGFTTTLQVLSKQLKTDLSTAANSLSAQFAGLSGQFANGKINGDQFSVALTSINKNIVSLGEQKGLMLMSETLKTIGSEAAIAASKVADLKSQSLLLEAIMLGIDITKESTILATAAANKYDTSLAISAATTQSTLRKLIADRKKTIEDINKVGTGTIGQDKKTAKQKYDEQYSLISNFFNAQEALIKQNRQSEADALQAKIDNAQSAIDAAQREIDIKQKLIDLNQHEIDLLNRRIELEYDRPLEKLSNESAILNNNLSLIENESKKINAQYESQEKALNAVATANEEILSQERSRLSIADALTSGDISAAAQAAQEARAQAAAARISQTQSALQQARDAAISGITAGGMTRDQIEQRLFTISQQSFSLEQQKKVLQAEIVRIQDKNYIVEQQIYDIKLKSITPNQEIVDKAKLALDQYNKQTDTLINNITLIGRNKTQWEETNTRIQAAQSANEAYDDGLKTIIGTMDTILEKWKKIATASKLGSMTTGYVGSTIVNPTVTPTTSTFIGTPFGQAGSAKNKMYGGKILPMNYGGYVPKYMATGGRIGSDSVPAMLTPGEFVVNKFAARRFGPLLNSINESKYPSMLGGKSASNVIPISSNNRLNDNSTAVYNYNLGFSISGNNLKPSEISRAVINEIKRVDQQRIRGLA